LDHQQFGPPDRRERRKTRLARTAEIVLSAVSGTSGQGLKFRVAGPGAGSVMIAIQGTGSSLNGVVRVHVVVTNASAAGSVQLQASNSGGSGTVTIKTNSDLVARRTG
jgi:hypothetical protein